MTDAEMMRIAETLKDIPLDGEINHLVARIGGSALAGVEHGLDPDLTWDLAFQGFHVAIHEIMDAMRPEYDNIAFTISVDQDIASL